MLMPLLGSVAPVFLFNDDCRADGAILRTSDFNKETGGVCHGDDFAIVIVYVFEPLLITFFFRVLRIGVFQSKHAPDSKKLKIHTNTKTGHGFTLTPNLNDHFE